MGESAAREVRRGSAPTVLVVDGEGESRAVARRALAGERFEVVEAASGMEGLREVGRADVVVLDTHLPDVDGLAVLERIRAAAGTPVIVATQAADAGDAARAVEIGADDCVAKPLVGEQLVARVRAALWRAGDERALTRLEFPGLTIDLAGREVHVDGRTVLLPRKEFDLLACLASEPGRTFGRDELLRLVWRSNPAWQRPATVTEHVRRLRRRVEADPAHPRWVVTVRGCGYRFAG